MKSRAKHKIIIRIIGGALIFASALGFFAGCQGEASPGIGGKDKGGSSPIELPWLPPIFYNPYFIFALILGVAVLALTVFMAVRIIREKREDKNAERAVAEEKWKECEDKEKEKEKRKTENE